jgi:hypothetical protein
MKEGIEMLIYCGQYFVLLPQEVMSFAKMNKVSVEVIVLCKYLVCDSI